MSARPLSSLLAHLESGARRAEPLALDPILLEAATESARRAGYAEGLAEGERRLATERLRLAQSAEAALDAAREAWVAGEGAHLRARLDEALAQIERAVTQGAADVLRPVLADIVAQAALARLAQDVGRLLAADTGEGVLRVCAPADMLGRLRAAIGETPRVDFVESDGPDAVATLGRAAIETCLAGWAQRLAPTES